MHTTSRPRINNKFTKQKPKKAQEIILLPQIDNKPTQKQIEPNQQLKQEGILTKLKGFFSGWFGSDQAKPQDKKKPQQHQKLDNSIQKKKNSKQQGIQDIQPIQKANSLQKYPKKKQQKNIIVKKQVSPQSKQRMMRLEEMIERKVFAIHPNKIYPKNNSNPYDTKVIKGAADLPLLSDKFVKIQQITQVKYRGPANRLDVKAQIPSYANSKAIYKEPGYYSQQRGQRELPYTLSLPYQNQDPYLKLSNINFINDKTKNMSRNSRRANDDILDIINNELQNSIYLGKKSQLPKLGEVYPSNEMYSFNTISAGQHITENLIKQDKQLLKNSRQLYHSGIYQNHRQKTSQQPTNMNFQQRKIILKSTPKYSRNHINN